jgi:hypothetical protein
MVGMKGLAAMAALAMIEQPTRYVAPAGCEPPSQTEDRRGEGARVFVSRVCHAAASWITLRAVCLPDRCKGDP